MKPKVMSQMRALESISFIKRALACHRNSMGIDTYKVRMDF